MKIAAVVVTYNRIGLFMECIDALLEQTRSLDSIIVIDNASTDGTNALFAEGEKYANIPSIDYQRMSSNLGGAGGFYEGIKYAYHCGYDWVWIMDDDTIPTDSALQNLVDALQCIKGDVSYLASTVYGEHGELMNVPEIDLRYAETGYSEWYKFLRDGIVKIETATFVSLLINRNAIKKVGFPYKDFFIWGDDKEYTFRLTRYYAPAYFVGKSEVIHKRKVVKAISIEHETDDRRIKQFYYNYRNILVNDKEYRHGIFSVLKRILKFDKLCLQIFFGKYQKKLKKIYVIQKGIWGYITGAYGKAKFKKRFEIG
jgi:GT2 family glycosyltransferase